MKRHALIFASALFVGDIAASDALAQVPATQDLEQFDFTGAWFEPATAGSGLLIELIEGRQLGPVGTAPYFFGTWFTYSDRVGGTEEQAWYTIEGRGPANGNVWSVDLLRTPPGAFEVGAVRPVKVGAGTIEVQACTRMVLRYQFDSAHGGRRGDVALERLLNDVSCEIGSARQANAPRAFLGSGGWFQPATAGQGVLVETNPNSRFLFGAWYTYTAPPLAPAHRWYTLQKGGIDPQALEHSDIGIFETTRGQFDTSAPTTIRRVGTARWNNPSCTTSTFAYQFTAGELSGRTGTVDLQRLAAPPAECRDTPTQAITVQSGNAGEIKFSLAKAGRISLAVYDATGQMVRTLLNASQRGVGSHIVVWDGRDDAGVKLASGQSYTFRILMTQGLKAEYLMTLQTNLPIGSAWRGAYSGVGGEDREVGLGNHDAPTSVASDESAIYAGSGSSEGTSCMVKMPRDGGRRIWSAGCAGWIGAGRAAMSVMGGRIYTLTQDGWIAIQGVNEPNFPYLSVGPTPGTRDNRAYVGSNWDAAWPGTERSQDGWAKHVELNPPHTYWEDAGMDPMDMSASDLGGAPQLAVSYFRRNIVQWRNPETGAVLDSVNIDAPRGVAFDNQGRLLIASNGQVFRVSRQDKVPRVIATGLDTPYRLAVDPISGDIFVAERGSRQQVVRLTSNGALVARLGRSGGRLDGLYVAKDFRDVTDIAADTTGGFLISERSGMRRIARFDAAGQLVKEWYAGSIWAPGAYPEPGNPSVVWMHGQRGEYVRAELDFSARTWRVHSTYRIGGLDTPAIMHGAGQNALKPRRVNGRLYLATDATNWSSFTVWLVDESQWSVRRVAEASFNSNEGAGRLFLWSDSNGDGVVQEAERRVFGGMSFVSLHVVNLRHDEALNYYGLNYFDAGVTRIRVREWNAVGAPVYEPLRSPSEMLVASFPPEMLKPTEWNGVVKNYGTNHPLAFSRDGTIYGAFGIGDRGWANVDAALVARWSADGRLLWKRKLGVGNYNDSTHTHVPGETLWSTFRNSVGVVHGALIAQDFNGGHNGFSGQAVTYVWDKDGLWVGGLFDSVDTSRVGSRCYNLASENGAGAVAEEPSTGEVLYFGSTESANHVYRISGWKDFVRAGGAVRSP